MLTEELIEIFKKTPPFHILNERDIEILVESVAMEYYPRGYKILLQDGPPSDALRLIKKGVIKVYVTSEDDDEIIIDYRSEGEFFGIISVISGDRSRATVQAVEDTICYVIPKDILMKIMERNPTLNEYFLKSYFLHFMDRTYDETRKRFTLFCHGDRSLFTTPVGAIIRREPVTISEDASIWDAARVMTAENIGSLIITNKAGVPVGLITDRDLRERVIARKRDVNEEVRHIMSSSLIRIDANELCFEALLKMIRYNIHHLLVIESGELKGIVSNHDFMLLQGHSPLVLIKEIDEAQQIEVLSTIKSKLFRIISGLLRDGAKAHNLAGLITEITEKIINRVVDFIEKRLGPPPLSYALFVYGDGGRRELTLNPYVKLGVILEDTNNVTTLQHTNKYFEEFVTLLNEQLRKIEYIDTAVLSTEEVRCFTEWKNLLKQWAEDPFHIRPDEDFVDLRVIRGATEWGTGLSEYLLLLLGQHDELMDYYATVTVENRPPLGFLRRFVVDKTGEHKDELNLYTKGLKPIVDSARIFAIEKGISDKSTIKRLTKLSKRFNFEYADDVQKAFEYIYTLLIHEQVQKFESGSIVDDFINPERLGTLEKKTLKEAFQLIANLYDLIEKNYKTERVS